MEAPYQVYLSRWFVLLFFSLNNAMNAFLWICFAAIQPQTSALFAVDFSYVNGLSLAFLLLFLPGTVLTSFQVERYGVRLTLFSGSALNCLGGWLRYLGAVAAASSRPGLGFAVLMLGQVLAGLAQPCFTNLPARISSDWFAPSQRDLATVVASLSNALGVAAGSVLPTLAVSAAGDMPTFLLGQALASTLFLAGTVYAVRGDRPPTPPSASAAARLHKDSAEYSLLPSGTQASSGSGSSSSGSTVTIQSTLHTMWTAYWGLLQDRNYLCLLAGFGVGLGLFNALLTLLAQLLQPCGYSDDFGGNAGGVLLGAGLLSAAGVGLALEHTRAYLTALRLGIVLAVLASVFFLASLQPRAGLQLLLSCGVLGACLIPLLPISLENAAECTYPVAEEVSSGLLLIVGNYLGLALVLGMQALIPQPPFASSACASPVSPVAGLVLGVLLLACLALFLFRKDYRRQAAEARGRGGEAAEAAEAASD